MRELGCRICGTKLVEAVFHLTDMPLTDDFVSVSTPERQEYIHDITIYRCQQCGTVQNPEDFDHETYYQDYQYSTGHSEFTQRFMSAYAAETFRAFEQVNGRRALSVLEIGSGDGQQLARFKPLGAEVLLGVEPSEYLARVAAGIGIATEVGLFGSEMVPRLAAPVDVCLSSYTFDHVRDPLDYLRSAHAVLSENGILALEIHDFGKIVDRTEYCLFEHEHTIYLDDERVGAILAASGFTVLSINPLPSNVTRGNSLIVIARKVASAGSKKVERAGGRPLSELRDLQRRVDSTIERIDGWIRQLPPEASLVGFGVGGRGVMTVAALSEYQRFSAMLDSNYESHKLLTPKTRIPVLGPDGWRNVSDSFCLVFSFGYFDEITRALLAAGFRRDRVVSLLDFYPSGKQHGS